MEMIRGADIPPAFLVARLPSPSRSKSTPVSRSHFTTCGPSSTMTRTSSRLPANLPVAMVSAKCRTGESFPSTDACIPPRAMMVFELPSRSFVARTTRAPILSAKRAAVAPAPPPPSTRTSVSNSGRSAIFE
jgi:hypothetical protein